MCLQCEMVEPTRPIHQNVIEALWPMVHNLVIVEALKAQTLAAYQAQQVLGSVSIAQALQVGVALPMEAAVARRVEATAE